MASKPPTLVAIDHDDYHAKHVGHTPDGRQFFLTLPFEPAFNGRPGCEYVALYLFDREGRLIEAKIDRVGPRGKPNDEIQKNLRAQRLQELGDVSFTRIEVEPFSVERFDIHFGLIAQEPDHRIAYWLVDVEPGGYMTFFEPWNSGDYDT